MKVYRIATEGTCYKPSPSNTKSALESLYYQMGYLLAGNKFIGFANSIYSKIREDDTGSYYFIFLEDALDFATCSYKPSVVLKIMEYDFKEDIVYNSIGYGIYENDFDYNRKIKAETYISDSKIVGRRYETKNIDTDQKSKVLVSEFRNYILTLNDYYSKNIHDLEYSGYDKLREKLLELSDEELLESYIKTKEYGNFSNEIYDAFVNCDFRNLINIRGERQLYLIKTKAITSKSSNFIFSFWDNARELYGDGAELAQIMEYNGELLAKNNLFVDYSKSGIDCRIDYTRMIEKKDYESAKRLLKSYRS